ncbi:hypothetical protein DL766_005597 [Monosporascus sp. MC13-8B]|uniref:Major facilitator superfamily (MFS) profile domain-containing protein n=1 Tax=Monosporascus cannonballus TaxID=155416 RepID=A0ABY0GX03_9PEZI|nr:hypothetical protein DL763_010919 [Monosporascus cannonballus]RYO79469.1 hypothetical protein DL762_008162 [Monosporascus cannonballus]RYP28983.1 hypothetical protein DL766_005597 [Monosporascus sp. MC13-8B]
MSSSSSSSSLSDNHVSQPSRITRLGSGLSNGSLRENSDHKLSERSPLLSSSRSEEEPAVNGQPQRDAYGDDYFQKTKSIWYLILTTIGIGGLQMAWACELSNGSPYLLSLGLSKSHLSLAWVAGPLTGTFVQPFVGIMSDKSRISWGKRKPFILGGAAATVIFLLFLSWSKEIMGGMLRLIGVDPATGGGKATTIIVAVISIYFLDVALNTEQVNSMASRILGIGNIIGFLAGYIDLPKYLWFLGHTQFQILSAIACIALCSTVLLSTLLIRERDPTLDGPPAASRPGLVAFFKKIFSAVRHLPPQTRNVCIVQFFAWIGLFPPLFYTTTFIGDLYVQPYLEQNPHMTPEELDELYERATRVGTLAMLIYSFTSLATNLILPSFIDPTYDNALVASSAPDESPRDGRRSKKTLLEWLIVPGFTLKRAWMLSHILFAASMFSAPFIRTVQGANIIIGLFGITWAMTLWAPWAIISAEISHRDLLIRAQKQRLGSIIRDEQSEAALETLDEEERRLQAEAESNETGIIMGIHNMAIAAPQFIATIVCSIVFGMSEKPRGVPGDHSIAVAFAVGGFFVLIAAFMVLRIKDDDPMSADAIATAERGGGTATAHSKRETGQTRTSMGRATLARNTSFASGLEY